MAENQKATVSDIIPVRTPKGGEAPQTPRKKITVDDLLEDLQQQLEISKIAKVGESLGAFNFGGGRSAPAAVEPSIDQLGKFGSMLGIDFTKITELRQREVESLRSELDKERRAAMEQRLSIIDNTIVKMTETMQAFIKNQQDQRNQAPQTGLFGMADQMTENSLTKLMLAKMLDLDGQKKEQRDPVDELLDRLTLGDRLKERLGIKEEPRPAIDPRLASLGKLDLVHELLTDERERERMKQEARLSEIKMEKLGGFFKMIQDYIPDVLDAVSSRKEKPRELAAARDVSTAQTPPPESRRSEPPPQNEAELPTMEELVFEEIACPHPGCGKRQPFPVNVPDGYGINCAYCRKLILKVPEKPDTPAPPAQRRPTQSKPQLPMPRKSADNMSRDKAREGESGYGEQLHNASDSSEDNKADS